MMSKKNTINFLSLALEFVSILVGVFLAFLVSEWQQKQERIEVMEKALVNVYREVQSNTATLERIHKNNQSIVDRMKKADPEDDSEGYFVPGVQLRHNAWDTLHSTGVAHYVPYETLSKLSEMYSMLEVYQSTGHKLTDSSLTLAAFTTAMKQEVDNKFFEKQYRDYFFMLVAVESQLLKSFNGTSLHFNQNYADIIKEQSE